MGFWDTFWNGRPPDTFTVFARYADGRDAGTYPDLVVVPEEGMRFHPGPHWTVYDPSFRVLSVEEVPEGLSVVVEDVAGANPTGGRSGYTGGTEDSDGLGRGYGY